MGSAVVVSAEEDAVVEVGVSLVQPRHDVMTLTPRRWSIASGEGAAGVSEVEGSPDGAGEQASLPAQI